MAHMEGSQSLDVTGTLYPALRVLAALRWGGVVLAVAAVLVAAYLRSAVQPRCARAERDAQLQQAAAAGEEGGGWAADVGGEGGGGIN